jgi:Insertion element 4 transposase N-terminal/Transposase DDE domain
LSKESVITRTVTAAGGVFAPGHLGELTQLVDFALVDAVLEETGRREKRLRLLPSRVVVYFVLALALFERASYRAAWTAMTSCLAGLPLVRPATSSLSRARRRVGAAPLKRLFATLAGPVGARGRPGVFWRGWRCVAVDGTHLHVPDDPKVTWRYPKRVGEVREFGYPLLRLTALVECGTRALLAAAFGPEDEGELAYAHRLLNALDTSMVLLADCGFDANTFLDGIRKHGAQFLVRSSARRIPTPFQHLGDGSYLARLGYGVLPRMLTVRIVEAEVTRTLADGTTTHEQWRLLTSLLDADRYPAHELVELYHERWQCETTYFSIKSTLLDGRVLRSHSLDGIDQEVYALLTVYQALIRAAADAAHDRPRLDLDRISFTVLLQAARDQVILGAGILPADGPVDLVGVIGTAALDALWPARRRLRAKARSRKNSTSKYAPNAGQHPTTSQNYTLTAKITFFETGLESRRKS